MLVDTVLISGAVNAVLLVLVVVGVKMADVQVIPVTVAVDAV